MCLNRMAITNLGERKLLFSLLSLWKVPLGLGRTIRKIMGFSDRRHFHSVARNICYLLISPYIYLLNCPNTGGYIEVWHDIIVRSYSVKMSDSLPFSHLLSVLNYYVIYSYKLFLNGHRDAWSENSCSRREEISESNEK